LQPRPISPANHFRDLAQRFITKITTFDDLFVSYRKRVADKARLYLFGIARNGIRKNMSQIAHRIPDATPDNLQNFISDSKWSSRAVMDRVAQQVNEQIGDPMDTSYIIDECGIAKKGDKSVGVARQWLGSEGKVDNGQVGVFAALCKNGDASLIDARLYLPQEWIDDPDRCRKAGIPAEFLTFKTKDEIALDMVRHARGTGIDFGWVGADAGYGKGLTFMKELHTMGETFMVDVHSDFYVFLKPIKPYLPVKDEATVGRTPSRYRVDQQSVRIDEWAKRQPQSAWKKIAVRESTKGMLEYEYLTIDCWVWEKDTKNIYRWRLVVRRNPATKSDYKYSLSNSEKSVPLQRLAFMQAQRYWVERTFEDAKGECGMADYEARGWIAWHHHMALVLMAQSFLLDERLLNRDAVPLLSCADVVELLGATLPSKNTSLKEIEAAMEARHRKRQQAIDSAFKCQGAF
jgi:SRSO17 transposase